MSTLAEIEAAIETLPASEVEKLAVLLEKRRSKKPSWPVPPPNVDRAELERVWGGLLSSVTVRSVHAHPLR